MKLVHNYLFHKVFCTLYFVREKENEVTMPHIAQSKNVFMVKTKEKAKSKKIAHRKKVSLEWLQNRLGHISTTSLMNGDTENVWQDIELRIYP